MMILIKTARKILIKILVAINLIKMMTNQHQIIVMIVQTKQILVQKVMHLTIKIKLLLLTKIIKTIKVTNHNKKIKPLIKVTVQMVHMTKIRMRTRRTISKITSKMIKHQATIQANKHIL